MTYPQNVKVEAIILKVKQMMMLEQPIDSHLSWTAASPYHG